MQRAVNQAEVAQDVADFVDRIDQLVTAFDHTTEQRIERVVWIHRILAIGMALLLIFTIIWLRARLLRPWKQLLSMARAVSQRDFTQRAHISGRNEMATLGMALNNMSEELAESYAVLERRVQEKTAGLEQKNEILAFLWQANRRLHSSAPLCERISPVLNGLQGLTLLRDIEVRVYDPKTKIITVSLPATRMMTVMIKAATSVHAICRRCRMGNNAGSGGCRMRIVSTASCWRRCRLAAISATISSSWWIPRWNS